MTTQDLLRKNRPHYRRPNRRRGDWLPLVAAAIMAAVSWIAAIVRH